MSKSKFENRFITICIDSNSSVISSGSKGEFIIPFDGDIVSYTVMGNTEGSATIDILKGSPATSICGINKIILDNEKIVSNRSIGWVTNIVRNETIFLNIESISIFNKLSIILTIKPKKWQ